MVPSRIASLFRRKRLASVDELAAFLRAEALRVAQVSLTGYLRARMGTRWPALFEDPVLAAAIEAGNRRGFHICLDDLVIHAVAAVGQGDRPSRQAAGLRDRAAGPDLNDPAASAGFAKRLAGVDWLAAKGPDAFAPSIATLIDAAPVDAGFRAEDRLAFGNALSLRWAEVRRRLDARADHAALAGALGRVARG